MSLSAVFKNASWVRPTRFSRWPKSNSTNTGKRLFKTICPTICHRGNCRGLFQYPHPANRTTVWQGIVYCRPCSAGTHKVRGVLLWAHYRNAGSAWYFLPSSFSLTENFTIVYSCIFDLSFLKHPGNVAKRNQDVNWSGKIPAGTQAAWHLCGQPPGFYILLWPFNRI